MGEISVRSPHNNDAPDLARIWRETCAYYAEIDGDSFHVPPAEGLVEWLEGFIHAPANDTELMLVADLDGAVAGMIDASLHEASDDAVYQMLRELGETRLFVNNLVVDRRYWRAGVGSALMKAAEQWAKDKGAASAGLDTYVGSPVSVPFYERRLGYKRRSIVFRKPLT